MNTTNNFEFGTEALLNELFKKDLNKTIDKAKNVKTNVKGDVKTFITPDLLKQTVNIIAGFIPNYTNKDKDMILINSVVDAVTCRDTMELHIKKAYKFIFGVEPKNFTLKSDNKHVVKEASKSLAKDIGIEVDKAIKITKNATSVISTQEQLKILNFFKSDILPKLEDIIREVNTYTKDKLPITSPEAMERLADKVLETEKKYKKTLEDKNITPTTDSAGDYNSFGEFLYSISNDFIKLTGVMRIWELLDRIINEIDKWGSD